MRHFTRPDALGAAAAVTLTLLGLGALGAVLAIRQAHGQQARPASAPSILAAGITLRSVTVELPSSDRMFPGTDADAINSNCLACHSAGMVLNQPSAGLDGAARRPSARWPPPSLIAARSRTSRSPGRDGRHDDTATSSAGAAGSDFGKFGTSAAETSRPGNVITDQFKSPLESEMGPSRR